MLEVARPSVKLRDKFGTVIIPLETVHIIKEAGMITEQHFRASKRSVLLEYEKLLDAKYIDVPKKIVHLEIKPEHIVQDATIDMQQKRYILESATEYLEYSYSKSELTKEEYLALFYKLSKQRATLGIGKKVLVKIPDNPAKSHRAIRAKVGYGVRDSKNIGFLGIRPAYHDLEDSAYGFLRGTQIEFLNIELSIDEDSSVKLENGTIISIVSLAQRSEFVDSFSWRAKFAFDRKYMDDNTNFIATVGGGMSWGNDFGYIYMMFDPLAYMEHELRIGIGSSIGFVIDKYSFMNTNFEGTSRFYDNGEQQYFYNASQNFRLSQNIQLQVKYDYIERYILNKNEYEDTLKVNINYYF